ncbi:copper amine oxidase N-terminal domain-containing protein [Paenibacillus pini]|uniref:Copper amine oxidase domain protein n=1 Tax=Paenibacillus pini JCM 16418 TaxID=1236976 RepID=W7Y5Q8_9BACL|nr:copper amine oxidase N-terminal domain-containing protein [Paenibacillus pini]GAF06100.1 copper amine oxidase domain protein [Paenibacillus pini JCM 16418]
MKRFKLGLALGLVLLLVILSGCQSVGGLDVSNALTRTLDVKTSESKSAMSIEIIPTAGKMDAEDQKMIDMINSFSVTIDHVIMQDASTASLEGALTYQGKKLPFHMSMDKKNLALKLEGMKQPVVISLDSVEQLGMGVDVQTGLSEEKAMSMVKDVSGFVLKHLPNPSSISLASVTDKVNGESVALQKLHVEIRGDELTGLVKGFLTSLSKDKEGIKSVVGALYDVYYPLYAASQASDEEEDGYEDTMGDFLSGFGTPSSVMADKEAAVIYLTNQLIKEMNKLLPKYDQEVTDLYADSPELKEVLGKNTLLAVDLFFDNKLNIRKQNVDLTVQMPEDAGIPIKQVKAHATSESWKINVPVTINKVDVSKGAWDPTKNDMTPGEILGQLDNQSELYRFLKEEMTITYKYFEIETPVDEDSWYYDYPVPYSVNNNLMVPLKFVADQLDAKVSYNQATKQITVTDDINGSTIVVKAGDKQAVVNGKVVKLVAPVTNREGYAFVPLRFIAESLGATITVDKIEQYIYIERN